MIDCRKCGQIREVRSVVSLAAHVHANVNELFDVDPDWT